MEDTLRATKGCEGCAIARVLILVLMEDTLRDTTKWQKQQKTMGLNPCFNGRYSQRARHTNPLYKRDWHL